MQHLPTKHLAVSREIWDSRTKTNSETEFSMRLGFCCKFAEASIKFRTTTATSLMRKTKKERLEKLSVLCQNNAIVLLQSLEYCAANETGCFRVNSQILPVKTHPQAGYEIDELPNGESIVQEFRKCGTFAVEQGLRTAFHPNQFVVLNSPGKRKGVRLLYWGKSS